MVRSLSLFFAALLVLIVAACGQGSGGSAPEPGASEPTASQPAPAEEPAPAAPTKVDPAAFTAQLSQAACDAIQRCKNEDLRGYIEFNMMFMGVFAAMDKTTGLEPIVNKAGQGLKQDKRLLLNREECQPLLAKLLELDGLTGPPLLKSIASKTTLFDEEAATQCIEGFKTLPSQCSEERQLTQEIKMGQAEALEKQFQGPLKEYLATCGRAVQGTIDEGATCENDAECKVGSCRRQEGSEGRACKARR